MNLIEKYMKVMGLKFKVELDRSGFSRGNRFCCIKNIVWSKNSNDEVNVEYLQHHCYHLDGTRVRYSDGNSIKGVNEGMLSYLGMDNEIDNFFEKKSRELAESHIKQFGISESDLKKITKKILKEERNEKLISIFLDEKKWDVWDLGDGDMHLYTDYYGINPKPDIIFKSASYSNTKGYILLNEDFINEIEGYLSHLSRSQLIDYLIKWFNKTYNKSISNTDWEIDDRDD